MRVFTATLGTETNTFAPMPTGLADFQGAAFEPARVATDALPAFGQVHRAVRERGAAAGWTTIESMIAFAQPSGITIKAAYETLRDRLIGDLANALPVDMVLLQIHGAMVAEGYPDAEGDLLARVRALVGPDVVVGAELDPHCHLSKAKVANADLLVLFKEYPHTDIYDRARDLVRLAEATAMKRVRPVMRVHDLGMITLLHTSREPARSLVDRLLAMEGKDGVLSVSIAHGFPWGDHADLGTRVLVVTDGDSAKAEKLARQIGDEIVSLRDELMPLFPDVDGAISRAMASNRMSVVLADSADNPGGGAGGDSTFILDRLLARKIDNAVIGPFWDPVVVGFCQRAGVGARLSLRLGGKVSRFSGAPLDVEAEVLALREKAVQTGLSDTVAPLGDCALIRVGGVRIVVNTTRTQAFGTDLFTQFGIDLATTKIIVVKSSQHFHAKFGPVASEVLYVDTPGVCPINFTTLPFRLARRDIWPFRR
jgi:microcystin degradation protein MlrC